MFCWVFVEPSSIIVVIKDFIFLNKSPSVENDSRLTLQLEPQALYILFFSRRIVKIVYPADEPKERK